MQTAENPRLPGRESIWQKVKNIISAGGISVTTDGAGTYFLAVPTPPAMSNIWWDNTRYALTNPANTLMATYYIPKYEYLEGATHFACIRGRFSGAGQQNDFYINGNYVGSVIYNGNAEWQFDIDIFVVDASNQIVTTRAVQPNGIDCYQYSDIDGTGYNFDLTSALTIEVYASDAIGSGVDMTSDAYRAFYCPPASK